ncbi:MAG: amidohydrolase family protein [Chloroflexota bacterium]
MTSSIQRIDIHAHVLEESTMSLLSGLSPRVAPRLEWVDDTTTLVIDDFRYPLFPRGGWDLERRIEDMDRTGVSRQVLSIPPFTFFYDQDPRLVAETAQIQNNRIAEILKLHSDRFLGFATVPLQSPALASAELERAMGLGLHGVEICTNVAGRNLDEPELDEFWSRAESLGAPILLHPHNVAAMDRLGKYYLNNLIGNPLDTTIAIASLIFGGVLDRFPLLKLCFVHGGGYFPYQWGRLEHGYHVRTEPHLHSARAPREYLDRFAFDTITHSAGALEYLIRTFGSNRVLLGTDYPFDMGFENPLPIVQSLSSITDEEKDSILGGNAARLIGA